MVKIIEEINCSTFNSEITCKRKKNCVKGRGVLILIPNQSVLKKIRKDETNSDLWAKFCITADNGKIFIIFLSRQFYFKKGGNQEGKICCIFFNWWNYLVSKETCSEQCWQEPKGFYCYCFCGGCFVFFLLCVSVLSEIPW